MTDYRTAGVDISQGNLFVERIKPHVATTDRPEHLSIGGGFGGLFALDLEKWRKPVLVSGTDGVGTKLLVAQMAGQHDTIGIDLVAMCVNDILTLGAEPLYFLDYLATGKLDVVQAEAVVKGIAAGCVAAGCALIGGETAEMPGFYPGGEYDVAGFTVGVVERDRIIDGSTITVGDKLIGLSSTGLHSNGYSLARKVLFDILSLSYDDQMPGSDDLVGDLLLAPTRIYVKPVLELLARVTVKGMAHITGGGLLENLPRIMPKGLGCTLDTRSWTPAHIFAALQDLGKIDREEMFRVFNMGIGFVLVVSPADAGAVIASMPAEYQARVIGQVDTSGRTNI